MFQKNVISVIALILALVSLVLSAWAVAKVNRIENECRTRLSSYEANEANDADEADEATQPIVFMELTNWTLTPQAQASGKAADIELSATIDSNVPQLTGNLHVSLNGEKAADFPCAFSGNTITANGTLPAANGYTYTLVLTAPNGSCQEFVLASPENPTETTAVYLSDSLNSYCNLLVENWTADDNTLTINSGYVQLQLPQLLTTEGQTTWEKARLILETNQNEIATHDLALETGEGSNSYELTLQSVALKLPTLKEGQELTLQLEITLSNGQTVTASGASWFMNEGELNFVVG